MVEQALRALLADRNVPEQVAESVLEHLLDRWSENRSDSNVVDHAWHSFLSDDLRPTQLVGPSVCGLPSKIRVARIMTLENLVRHHVPMSRLGFGVSKLDVDHLVGDISDVPLLGNVTASHTGISWTCLSKELQESSLEEVESGLGLYYLIPSTPLVAVEYTVDSSELHVPTVLDARLQPGFVSKAVSDEAIPRAWNWEHGRWGLSEMVHRSGVSARDVTVRFLGRTSPRFRPAYDGLASFTLPYSAALEDFVALVLRQALAHRGLEPFLAGQTGILDITPNDFEHFVALLYSRQGYNTTVTKASRDGGVDIIAVSDSRGERCLLIQAKHTRGTVGIRVVRELIGARFLAGNEYGSYMLVVATTGRFSKPAREAEEEYPTHLRLVDYDELQLKLRTLKHVGLTDIVHQAVAKSRTVDGLARQWS